MRAELLWKVFAFLATGSVVFDAMAIGDSSIISLALLLFKGLAVLGLFGFAWKRVLFTQRLWQVVVLIQFMLVLLLLGKVVAGLIRFSDPSLFLAVLQALLITGLISGFTLIGLFLYAWSPSLWASGPDRPNRSVS
jgi:hypothetical protein